MLAGLFLQADAQILTGGNGVADVKENFAFLAVHEFATGGGGSAAWACAWASSICLLAVKSFEALLDIFLNAEFNFPDFELAFGDHGVGVLLELEEVEAFLIGQVDVHEADDLGKMMGTLRTVPM